MNYNGFRRIDVKNPNGKLIKWVKEKSYPQGMCSDSFEKINPTGESEETSIDHRRIFVSIPYEFGGEVVNKFLFAAKNMV